MVLLENLIVAQLVKKSPAFYETKELIPYSQQAATGPYPKLHIHRPHPHTLLL